jgi:hypothetical protein
MAICLFFFKAEEVTYWFLLVLIVKVFIILRLVFWNCNDLIHNTLLLHCKPNICKIRLLSLWKNHDYWSCDSITFLYINCIFESWNNHSSRFLTIILTLIIVENTKVLYLVLFVDFANNVTYQCCHVLAIVLHVTYVLKDMTIIAHGHQSA